MVVYGPDENSPVGFLHFGCHVCDFAVFGAVLWWR
jgi:hypothetical protein